MKFHSLQNNFVEALQNQVPLSEQKFLIVLHGLGDSFTGYLWLPEFLDLPKLNYLVVNAPNKYDIGFSWYEAREGWLKDDTLSEEEKRSVASSRQRLFDLLQEMRQVGIKEENIAFFGFSQGCVMSLEVALKHPATFAGFCGVSGYLFNRYESLSQRHANAINQNILITHGLQDELIPFARAEEDANLLLKAGLNIQFAEFSKTHTMDAVDELPMIREWLMETFDLN
jgi:phospholipase/carboxylesterase